MERFSEYRIMWVLVFFDLPTETKKENVITSYSIHYTKLYDELQPELFTDDLYNDCVRELYKNNEAQQLILSKRNFTHLFVEDIIFYQRPLKSQKSSIGNCTLEYRLYKDKAGKDVKENLKATPKSNPYYQEFRVWQWLSNLKIYNKSDDSDITAQLIKSVDRNNFV